MAVPASYTDEQVAEYMHSILGNTAAQIGWSVDSGSYDEAVIDALLLLGMTTSSEAEDIGKLRIAARLTVWRAVAAATVGDIDYSTDGQSFQLAQVHEHATNMALRAETDAIRAGIDTDAGTLVITPVEYTGGPFRQQRRETEFS